MRVRQKTHNSVLLLIVLASLACTIRMPEEMARYVTPTPVGGPPTEVAVLTNVITNAITLPTPGAEVFLEAPPPAAVSLVEPAGTPAVIAIAPPVPAALAEMPAGRALVKDAEFAGLFSVETINQLQGGFYPSSNQVPAQFAVDRLKMHFKSRNELGHWVSVRAEVFVPRVDTPTEFPLFVYGAGTTGINNLCAPLDEDTRGRNWGQYQVHLASYAAQGFITVLPHWQGYDDQTRKHNYFIAGLEASIMLDATRAVYELFNQEVVANQIQARPAPAIFYGGYSQGGHGAFAALDAALQYAPELPIKGIVGHATAPNVEALLRERPPLAPYIIYSYLNYYGADVINPEAVFLPKWLGTFYADASSKCVDEAYKYYPEDPKLLYRPEFMDVLYGDRLAEAFPAFKEALEYNYVGNSSNTSVPVILFHGDADTIVTPETHNRFVARLCNLGKSVNYKLYPEINHFQTRQFSFVDSLNWMRDVLSGQTPESQCSEFFNSQFE